jgi:hypothetical protein
MKTVRFVFAFAALSLFALPSFASICGFCDVETNECVGQRGLDLACKEPNCEEFISMGCARSAQAGPELLAADYSVASVEIVTPAKPDVRVEQPSPVASLEITK